MNAETQKGEAKPEKEAQSPKDFNLSTDMFCLLARGIPDKKVVRGPLPEGLCASDLNCQPAGSAVKGRWECFQGLYIPVLNYSHQAFLALEECAFKILPLLL